MGNKRHGRSVRNDRAYTAWANMKSRCNNPNFVSARLYYDKGISYVSSWDTFEGFYATMGDPPIGMSLDRIDGNKDYSPENCRWATPQQQAQNKSNSTLTPEKVGQIKARLAAPTRHGQQKQLFLDLAEEFGVSWVTIRHIRRGNTWTNIQPTIYLGCV